MARVFFLVHKSIARESWNVEWHEGKNAGMVATLHLALGDNGGDLAIHSVYNPNQPDMAMTVKHLEELLETTTRSGRDIVMGDFNPHHPSWSGSLYRGDPERASDPGKVLSEGMHVRDMNLVTFPGTETFFATNKDSTVRSCIDLTFVSSSLKSFVKSCSVLPPSPEVTNDKNPCPRNPYNPWPNTDHHPVLTILDLQVERDDTLKFHYDDTDKQKYNEILEKELDVEELKKLELTPTVIEEQLKHVMTTIMDAINRTVPTSLAFPPPTDKPMSLSKQRVTDGNGVAPAPAHTIPNSLAQQKYHEALKRDRDKEKAFIDKVGQSPNGTWETAKIGKVRSQPRIIKSMPALTDSDGKKHSAPEAKIDLMAKSIWANNDKLEVIPLPDLPPDRKVLQMDKSLGDTEIKKIISGLNKKKTPGVDLIPAEALKLGREIIAAYLTVIFRACLELNYFPEAFKMAMTTMIPKDGKDSYSSVKSWRPIALLSSIGKILEKIMATRLSKLALDHNLLPETQFGAPGKSTSQAIKALLHVIHRNWNRKMARKYKRLWQRVSMMGLDISGAFDGVNREDLLKTLVELGVDTWFIHMLASFLSDRWTVLKIPQAISDAFRINIGIPQGSPLSPILFLFVAAPLLRKLNAYKVFGVQFFAFSYVDDTYIVAISQSYAKNCQALKEIHDKVIDPWSAETGLAFSPSKYSITHFRSPNEKGPMCELLPDINGVRGNKDCFKKNKNKVLGVILDPQLTFKAHVDDIHKKVRKSTRHLRLVSGRKWGLRVQQAREFYLGKIFPIFAYACEAWFFYTPTGARLPCSLKTQVERLKSIHYEALKAVTAYFGNTARQVVQKEFHIPNIEVYLYKRAQAARALSLGFLQQHPYVPQRTKMPKSWKQYNPIASDILDDEARGLAERAAKTLLNEKGGDKDKFLAVWGVRDGRKKAINAQAFKESEVRNAKLWDGYRRQRADRQPSQYRPVCLEEDWGPESLKYYKDMKRAESTLLLELRTERIGLNGPLHDMKVTYPVVSFAALDQESPAQLSGEASASTTPSTTAPTTPSASTASPLQSPVSSALTSITASATTSPTSPITNSTKSTPAVSDVATAPAVEPSPPSTGIIRAACHCGHRHQNVFHMLFHCPDLDTGRQKLINVVGRMQWTTLLTTYAKVTTQWAMVYFPLAQYDIVREDSPFFEGSLNLEAP